MGTHATMASPHAVRVQRVSTRRLLWLFGLLSAVVMPRPAAAQWSTTYEQFYLQASHNWTFRSQYQHADRLFNAFDYGHAILYETPWRFPDAPAVPYTPPPLPPNRDV